MEAYGKFSRIYDQLINEDINYKTMAEFVLKHTTTFTNYLDLGTGTGNLSTLIGSFFKETYLVDSSVDMLTMASDKFMSKELSFQPFAIPMTEIKFSKKFSLITSSTDSINYLIDEDDVKTLFHKVYAHLDYQGVFIFDLNSPYKIKEILGNHDYIYNTEDLVYTWQNTLDGNVVEMDLNFFIKENSLYERFEEIHLERSYEVEDIRNWLNEAQLELVGLYPGYEEGPILTNTERFVFIARKKEK